MGELGLGQGVEAGDEVIISTTKPDKYDRYLADVFVAPAGAADSAENNTSLATSHSSHPLLFLNNALLENGHAILYDGGAKEE